MAEEKTHLSIGKRLKAAREKKRMTAPKLAKAVGVATSTYWNWEYNRREPRLKHLKQIAEILETSTDFLLEITDNPEPKDPTNDLIEWLNKERFKVDGLEVHEYDLKKYLIENFKMSVKYYKDEKRTPKQLI